MKLVLLATAILFFSCFTFGQQENRSIQKQKLTFSITDTLMDNNGYYPFTPQEKKNRFSRQI